MKLKKKESTRIKSKRPGETKNIPLELAKGGIINRPTNILAGEAGAEAYVPLPDGKSIPVELRGFPDNIKSEVSIPDGKNMPVELRGMPDSIKRDVSILEFLYVFPWVS